MLKNNLPFVIAAVIIGVVFVAAAVFVQRTYAGRNEVRRVNQETEQELESLSKTAPTAEHLEYAKAQLAEAEKEYADLKKVLLTWWDKSVYTEERNPTIFLGNLQELKRRIILFAERRNQRRNQPAIVLGTNVPLMGFDTMLTGGTPPDEVTPEMLKQKSIMSDIILLLIEDQVYSIDSIVWQGPQKGGKLYDKYVVSVSFTCKYPQLAKFQSDLVKKSKTQVVLPGDRGEPAQSYELPRNFLVVEELSYTADDMQVARALAGGATAGGATTTGSTRYGPSGSGSMGGHNRAPVSGASSIRPPGSSSAHEWNRTGGGTRGPSRNTSSSAGSMRNPSRNAGGSGSMRPPSGTIGNRTGGGGATQKPAIEGREPQYNVLQVDMTISMVDFGEAIRGKIETPEDDKKPTAASRPNTTSTANQ